MDQRRFALYINCGIKVLYAAVITITSPLLTYISSTFNLSLSHTGIVFTANFVGYVSLILLGGILADKLSKKTVLITAMAGLAISLLLFSVASGINIACLIMFFIGGFGGITQSVSNAVLVELYPDRSTHYISIAQVFFGVGALIGPVAAGIAVGAGVPWQRCYIALGAIFLVFTILFFFNKMPVSSDKNNITWNDVLFLIRDVRFLLICLCLFLYTGSEVGGWGWLSTFVKQNLHFSTLKSSFAVGLFWISIIVGRFICLKLTEKSGIRNLVLTLSFSSAIVTLMFGMLSSNPYLIWLLIILMGLTYSGIWPLLVAYGCEKYENKGTVSALLVGSGGVGSAVIPLLIGMMAHKFNTSLAMISPSLLLLGLGLIFGSGVFPKPMPKKVGTVKVINMGTDI